MTSAASIPVTDRGYYHNIWPVQQDNSPTSLLGVKVCSMTMFALKIFHTQAVAVPVTKTVTGLPTESLDWCFISLPAGK